MAVKGELILVRHGKAENREVGKADFDRLLTDKEKAELAEFMQTLLPILEKKPYLIWTSPLLRAKQTAVVFQQALQLDQVVEKDFLASGDLDALKQALNQVNEHFAVICVGHEPILSSWVKTLTGQAIPFKKAGVASLLFEEEVRLDWRLAPK